MMPGAHLARLCRHRHPCPDCLYSRAYRGAWIVQRAGGGAACVTSGDGREIIGEAPDYAGARALVDSL